MNPEEQQTNDETPANQDNSLETAGSSSLENTPETFRPNNDASTAGKIVEANPVAAPAPKEPLWRRTKRKLNIYLLLFILLLIVSGSIVVVTYLANKKSSQTTIKTQTLSQDTLDQLATTDVTVGDPKQVLSVQSNAVFAGKVLIRDSLDVAGTIQVGGSLSVPGITVSGNSVFEQIQVNKSLSVQGDTSVQGQLAVQKNLTVAGGGTFGGAISAPTITVNSLQLSGTLTITRHVAVGGTTPGRTNGSALGSGGTTAVSGSDTAGSINVNTGSGASAGCFLTVNFTQKYNSTPRVIVTPIGSAAGSVGFYVDRTTSNFNVCAANTPLSNSSFGFDYWIIE
jgi:cytoskeletal protein CcmA (bactofilin family)